MISLLMVMISSLQQEWYNSCNHYDIILDDYDIILDDYDIILDDYDIILDDYDIILDDYDIILDDYGIILDNNRLYYANHINKSTDNIVEVYIHFLQHPKCLEISFSI